MGRRSAFVAVVLLCGLVACDDEPTPDIPDPTPSSTSPSVTDSVSPTTPTETPAALTPEETVRAWVAARNQALQDGDTTALRLLSQDPCETCEEHIRPIEDVFAAGGSFDTPGWAVDSAKVDGSEGDETRVNAAVTMAAGSTIQEAGAEPVTYPEDKRIMVFRLRPSDSGSLLVSFIGYIS